MRTPLKLLFNARKMQLASASGILCMIVTKRMTLNYVSKVSKYPIDAARLIVYIKRRKVLVWIDYYNPNYQIKYHVFLTGLNFLPFVLVYPADYIDSRNDCVITKENTLEMFSFPTEMMPNSSMALIQCEKYCAEIPECWGCSSFGNEVYSWYAIRDCQSGNETTQIGYATPQQKPGMYTMYITKLFKINQNNGLIVIVMIYVCILSFSVCGCYPNPGK